MIGLSKPSSLVSVSICSGSASGPARINAGLPGIKRINENIIIEHKNKTGITWKILFMKYFNIYLLILRRQPNGCRL